MRQGHWQRSAHRRVAMPLLLLALAACSRQAPPPQTCVDTASATVWVEVTNNGQAPLMVPQSRPNIGCCDRTALTIAITDAAGRELDRCGFSDNFDIPREMPLQPGESIRYSFSQVSLSSTYCKVDLTRQYVTAHHGRSLGTQPLQPCATSMPANKADREDPPSSAEP